jgi:hypothetical protein
MVNDIPKVNVQSVYGYGGLNSTADNTYAAVVECSKGVPNAPVFITGPAQLAQNYGITMDAYWGVGGQPMYVTRAIYEGEYDETTGDYPNPALNAVHYLYDDAATPQHVVKLTATSPGTFNVYLTAGPNSRGGNDIVLVEDETPPEYYVGVSNTITPRGKTSVENLVERINEGSFCVTAEFKVLEQDGITTRWDTTFNSAINPLTQLPFESIVAGSDSLALTGRVILGSTPTGAIVDSAEPNVPGSDGVVKVEAEQAEFDIIPNDNANEAHRTALATLESVTIAGVFTSRAYDTVYAEYAAHAEKMNTPQEHGWRFAIIGAQDDATMTEMLWDAINFNSENVLYVGQGVTDMYGVEYTPRLATQVLAGKLGYTPYQNAVWGGNASKILAANGINFIASVLPLPGSSTNGTADTDDRSAYNSGGVITFRQDTDGCRIFEGVTTAQDNGSTTDEDEIAVVRIVRHAKYEVYNRCYSMLGENISATFQQDLQNMIAGDLATMTSVDGALTNDPTTGLLAYSVLVQLSPRSLQLQGKVNIQMTLTPVHAAREIDVTMTIG